LLKSLDSLNDLVEVNFLQTAVPWVPSREIVTKVEDTTDPKYGCRPEDRSIQLQIKYGIINLDKPPGPSSHEVVAWIKRMMNLDHAGHGGTLEAA
jgi:H/ACA ribonucleoprotein complex subunit 4